LTGSGSIGDRSGGDLPAQPAFHRAAGDLGVVMPPSHAGPRGQGTLAPMIAAGTALWPVAIAAAAGLAGALIGSMGNLWTARTTVQLNRQARLDERRWDVYVDMIRDAYRVMGYLVLAFEAQVVGEGPSGPALQTLFPHPHESSDIGARAAAYGTPRAVRALKEFNAAAEAVDQEPMNLQRRARAFKAGIALIDLVRGELGSGSEPIWEWPDDMGAAGLRQPS
jgi:hypothetical protein